MLRFNWILDQVQAPVPDYGFLLTQTPGSSADGSSHWVIAIHMGICDVSLDFSFSPGPLPALWASKEWAREEASLSLLLNWFYEGNTMLKYVFCLIEK